MISSTLIAGLKYSPLEDQVAKTIARATGMDNSRIKNVHRLGSKCAEGQANTYRTFTTAYVAADGSGYVHVKRDGKMLHNFTFGPEGNRD